MRAHFVSCLSVALFLLVVEGESEDSPGPISEVPEALTLGQPIHQTDPPTTASPSPCPSGMKHVIGDFCPNVVQNCLVVDKTVHNVNGYVRCLEFDKTQCLSKTRQHLDFCMDEFEWPNKAGQKPTVMVSYYEMEKNCSALGKRLCHDYEFSLACEGPEMFPYPTGYKRDTACNIDHPQRQGFDAATSPMTPKIVSWLDQSIPSDENSKCVSYYGVKNLTGNADEIVINSDHGQPMDPMHPDGKKQYYSAEMGGAWLLGHRARCRPKTTVHDENAKYYEISSRCCTNPL